MRQKTLALYIRLSKEDDDVGLSSEKGESNSITNQRMLLYDYLKSHPEFQDYRIIEKCDDGYSGKKFDRPQFVELMELVRRREVDCILVKDGCVIIEPTQKGLENQGFVAGSICF